MRTTWAAALAVVAFSGVTGAGRAGDRETALAVVEEAIKAHGGENALNQARNLSRTGEGTLSLGGKTSPFTEETIQALPDRIRLTVDLGKGQRLTLIVNGDKAWELIGGATLDLSKERIDEAREEAYVTWLTTLTPLLKDTFTLVPIPDSSVSGSPAAGVKVSSKDHIDSKLYFDKRTHLLVKIERRARVEGVLIDKTYLFSDYKDVDGVKLPIRESQMLAGKKYIDRLSATYKLLRRPDDAAFVKP